MTTEEVLESIIKVLEGDESVSEETITLQTETIRNSAQELLRGIMTLSEEVSADRMVAQVWVEINLKTTEVAQELRDRMSQGQSLSDGKATNARLLMSIRGDPRLAKGGVGIVIDGNRRHLISVGMKSIKNTNKQSILRARKIARLKAERGLLEFVEGTQIQVQEVLSTVITTKESGANTIGFVNEEFLEEIRARGSGILVDVQELGVWRYAQSLHLVLGLELE